MLQSYQLTGEPTQVDARAIERELTALWRQAAEGEASGGTGVTRAIVLNLVVLTPPGGALLRATETVARLTGRTPNRAIVVAEAAGGAELFDAWVQAHCQVPAPGRPQVCGEQITVEARGPAAARTPGLVLALLAPEVPVVVWWARDDPPAGAAFERLVGVADRLIVDTARMGPTALAEALRLADAQLAPGDLAWGRLTPWREQVAQLFDAPAQRRWLAAVERVTVTHGAGAAGAVAGRLMAGWLASRLGWQPTMAGGLARPDGGELRLELREATAETPDGSAGVTIDCGAARFSVARAAGSACLTARAEVDGRTVAEQTTRLDAPDDAALIAEELRLPSGDPVYEGALRAAVRLG